MLNLKTGEVAIKPRFASNYQKWEEARIRFSPRVSRAGAWP
jgi:hypothetical protein